MEKTMFMGLTVAALAITMIASSVTPAVYADKGGDPNNSDQAQENANERHTKKVIKLIEARNDGNPNNDNGPSQAHDNTHDGKGVDCC